MQYDRKKVNIKDIKVDGVAVKKGSKELEIRYSLSIPFVNVEDGVTVMIIMMNPSKANDKISDNSIDKWINFFFNKTVGKRKIKKIKIYNIFSIYASKPAVAFDKIKHYNSSGEIDSILKVNRTNIENELKYNPIVVCAWGKPTEGSFPYIYYYREVNRIIDLIFKFENKVYVPKVKENLNLFTKSNDPRHPAGLYGNTMERLVKITKNELLGL